MGFTEKIINVFNPDAAIKRAKAKNEIDKMGAESEVLKAKLHILDMLMGQEPGIQVTNSGYSHGGASRRRTWANKYHS